MIPEKYKFLITGHAIRDIITGLVFVGIPLYILISVLSVGVDKGYTFLFFMIPFICMGIFLLYGVFSDMRDSVKAQAYGTRYQAKVVGYEFDTSNKVNREPVKDIIVAFYKNGIPYHCVLNTDSASQREYPVGSTVDIYDYKGLFYVGSKPYDDYIRGEAELMAIPVHNNVATFNIGNMNMTVPVRSTRPRGVPYVEQQVDFVQDGFGNYTGVVDAYGKTE